MKSKWFVKISIILSAAFCFFWYLLVSVYYRPNGDDFCFLEELQKMGVLRMTLEHYFTWEGSVCQVFFIGIGAELLPHKYLGIYGPLCLLLIAFLCERIVHHFEGYDGIKLSRFCFFVLFHLSIIWSLPDRLSNLYWYTGIMSYGVPIIFALMIVLTIINPNLSKWDYVKLVVLSLIFSLFRLNYSVFAITLLSGYILLIIYRNGQNGSKFFKIEKKYIVLFCSLCIGFLMYIVAPGNYIRLNASHQLDTKLELIGQPVLSLVEILNGFIFPLLPLVILILVSVCICYILEKKYSGFLKLRIPFTFVTLLCILSHLSLFTVIKGSFDVGPFRTVILITYMMVISLGLNMAYFLMKLNVKEVIINVFAVFLLFVSAALSMYKTPRYFNMAKSYAEAYDHRIEFIKKSEIQNTPSGKLLFLNPLPDNSLFGTKDITCTTCKDNPLFYYGYVNYCLSEYLNSKYKIELKPEFLKRK